MIKKIQTELVILIVLVLNVFVSLKADLIVYNYFENLDYGLRASYLKDFFVRITELGDAFWYFLIIISLLVFSFVGKKSKKLLEDYPRNGWSYFGLHKAHKALGNEILSDEALAKHKSIWQMSDIELQSSIIF